jgi:DNA-binding NarL/FixJ family response regulator
VLPLPVITSALVLTARGDHAGAADRLAEARRLLEERTGGFIEGWYWYAAGMLAEDRGDPAHAVLCYTRMGSWSDARGDVWMLSLRASLVHALLDAGRPSEALAEARRLATAVEGRDLPLARLTVGAALTAALAAAGDPGAVDEAERTLARTGEVDGALVPAAVMLSVAGALLAAGRRERAATLLREAEAVFAAAGWPRRRALAARLLEQCGVPSTASAKGARHAAPAASSNSALSGRELEVATLAGSGLSSRAIALRLCISERTVENHLQRVYGKLAVHGRAALIARMANGHAVQ